MKQEVDNEQTFNFVQVSIDCDCFKMVNRYIEIEFDGEVGRDKGSWKGGCTGCSYTLLPNETPEECIRRMEKERSF